MLKFLTPFLAFALFVGFPFGATASEDVDGVFKTYNTFKNSKHLNEDYDLVKVLDYSDKRAFAIVYEKPQGENQRFYRYLFVNDKNEFLYEISLGSYEAMTRMDRELGNIAEDERLYHLDLYCPSKPDENGVSGWSRHSSLGFFTEKPEFESLTKTISEKEGGKFPCKEI